MVCISDCFRNNYGDIATAVRTNYRMAGNGLLWSPSSNSVCFNADAMATIIKKPFKELLVDGSLNGFFCYEFC